MTQLSARRILILGGTHEARRLADELSQQDRHFSVITSLAGRTQSPIVPAGAVRVGGFGGINGLHAFLIRNAIDILIDATHPFATRMTFNAIAATRAAQCSYYRLCRPPWVPHVSDRWTHVDTIGEAAQKLKPGSIALLTIGHQRLAAFAARRDVRMIARTIEAPAEDLPDHITIVRSRPPFSLTQERDAFVRYRIDTLVTKNAGGSSVEAKLAVARERAIQVIMIKRPASHRHADAGTVKDMLALLRQHVG